MRFKEIRLTPWDIKAHRCQIKGAFSNRPITNWILSYFGLWFENLKSDYHCCKDGLGSASVAIKGKKGCCFGRIYDLEKYTCFFDGGKFYITDLLSPDDKWPEPLSSNGHSLIPSPFYKNVEIKLWKNWGKLYQITWQNGTMNHLTPAAMQNLDFWTIINGSFNLEWNQEKNGMKSKS